MERKHLPRAGFILSMVIFGTMGPFVKAIGISSAALALCRAVMAAVLVGLFLLITRRPIALKQAKKSLLLLLLSGAAMGFNWIFLFEAYNYTSVSVATLAYYFAPVLVTVLCPILFKENMKPLNWICFGFSSAGLALLIGFGNLSAGPSPLVGISFGLCAAVLYATVMILNKYIKDVDGLQRTFLQFLAAVAVLLPYVLCTGGIAFSALDSAGWWCLLAVGILHTGGAYCLYFSGLKALSGQKAAILSYIDPLVAVIISITVLHEAIHPLQLLGGGLILGFTLLNELKS